MDVPAARGRLDDGKWPIELMQIECRSSFGPGFPRVASDFNTLHVSSVLHNLHRGSTFGLF